MPWINLEEDVEDMFSILEVPIVSEKGGFRIHHPDDDDRRAYKNEKQREYDTAARVEKPRLELKRGPRPKAPPKMGRPTIASKISPRYLDELKTRRAGGETWPSLVKATGLSQPTLAKLLAS